MEPKIYGPYLRKDGRKHIIKIFPDGSRKTQSYSRHVMEVHLGRCLLDSETVDHISGDFFDDRIENLQIMSLVENVKKAWSDGTNKPKEWFYGVCIICQSSFRKDAGQVRHNQKQGKSGPFCSRVCAGKHRK